MGLKARYILFSPYISYTKQVEGSGVFVQQAIAILDSGVGGLTVVKEVMRQLPREKIIYFEILPELRTDPVRPRKYNCLLNKL